MRHNVICFFIIFCFYIIGAYATTDISRLLKGAELSTWNPNCYCPICKEKIRLIDQIPVFSYIFMGGRCRKCNSKIPISNLFFEMFIWIGLSIFALSTGFSWLCFVVSIIFYEILKIGCFCIFGIREKEFLKNYIFSLFSNLIIFLLLSFLFLLEHVI